MVHRLTQTTLNRMTAEYYTQAGWRVIYQDMPGGSRSGIGITAQVNSLFERLYNMIPDIVAIKGNVLMIGEVDISLNEVYINKFLKYASLGEDLLKAFNNEGLSENLSKLSFSFTGIRRTTPTHTIPDILVGTYLLSLSLTDNSIPRLTLSFLKN